MKISNKDKILEAMITLLDSEVGYSIDLFGGLLTLRPLEDGRFAVSHQEYVNNQFQHIYEEIFESPIEAVIFFEVEREKYQIGFDFEH